MKFLAKKTLKKKQKESLLANSENEDQEIKVNAKDESFSFNPFPRKAKLFKRKESVALRQCFLVMFFSHILIICVCDIYAYSFEVISFVTDLVFLWADYYNYMTLDKPTCLAQILAMVF